MKDIIIIPTYNEKDNIKALIPLIFETIPGVSVVVVDDNSPDGTGDTVLDLKYKYPNLSLLLRKNKDGLGKAYLHAFEEILKNEDVKTVTMMDADFSHHPKYLVEMFKKSKDYSVVIGSRYVNGGKTLGWERWRLILSFFANLYCRSITGMSIKDCTSGFNVIHADLLKKVDFSDIDMSGYAFIMELKYNLYLNGATFYEVPIVFTNRVGGESKMSGHIISEGIIAPWKMRWKKTINN